MTTETTLLRAENLLEPWAGETTRPYAERLDVSLVPESLVVAVEALVEDAWGYLAAVTGVDLGPDLGMIEVLYHFCSGAAVVTLRVQTSRAEAVVPTICPVIPSASFYERELSEMLGVIVTGTPNPARLFLPDEWPDGVYPLRKDFDQAALKELMRG